MRNLNDIFDIDNSNNVVGELEMAVEQLGDGNNGSASYHFSNLLYDEISKMDQFDDEEISLFRFTKLTTLNKGKSNQRKPVIEDILGKKLTFGNPKDFNDPMDPIVKEWLNIKKKEAKTSLNKKTYSYLVEMLGNLRICCLSKKSLDGYEKAQLNPLMWAHYANMHRGICIEYTIGKKTIAHHNDSNQVLRLGNVRYRDHKSMSSYITLDNALLAKGSAWEYE